MVKKSRVVLFVAVILLLSTQNLSALDSSNIERVRESVGTGKLSSSNLAVLEDFVSEAVTEMLLAEDLTQIKREQVEEQRSIVGGLDGVKADLIKKIFVDHRDRPDVWF